MQIRQVVLARSTFPVGQTLMALHIESVVPGGFGIHIHQIPRPVRFHIQTQEGRGGHA